MRNAEITGWGKCMPPNVLSNHDLEQLVDTSDEWITTRTGIKERRISHVETSDLAAVAGLEHVLSRSHNVGMVRLSGQSEAEGEIAGPHQATVDTWYRQDRLSVLEAGPRLSCGAPAGGVRVDTVLPRQ